MDDLDDLFECLAILFTPWGVLLTVIAALVVLSLLGVIPWSEWL